MSDVRLSRNSDYSDPDISLDSGIYIPRRTSIPLTAQERAKKAALSSADEQHWRQVNQNHLNSGIPTQTVSLVIITLYDN